MTRFKTQIWQPDSFYGVNFGTQVIDELLNMPRELSSVQEEFSRYEQYKRDVTVKEFEASRFHMLDVIERFEAVHSSSPKLPPSDSRPLYEFARFFGSIGDIESGLGTPTVRIMPGHNRGNKYVLAGLGRDGVADVESGAELVPLSHRRNLSQLILRRVGICYAVDEQGG